MIRVRVRAFGDLMSLLGDESTIELEADPKVEDLIHKLAEKVGSPRKDLLGPHKVIGPDLVILLNGRNIKSLKELKTRLNDGDIVTLLPPVVGGRILF